MQNRIGYPENFLHKELSKAGTYIICELHVLGPAPFRESQLYPPRG